MPPVVKKKKKVPAISKLEIENDEKPVISGQLEKKVKKQQNRKLLERGVVFIKHLPHGFFEDQLRGYFEQFGKVTRLRLARSRRTGGSKGYAFIEFQIPEVAKIAAETMDNYLMFQKIIKASYIPPENQKFNYFKSKIRKVENKAGKTIYVSGKTRHINNVVKKHNDWNEESYSKRTKANLKKLRKMKEMYGDLGIDFDQFVLKLDPNGSAEGKTCESQLAESSKDKLNALISSDQTQPDSLLLIKKRKNDSKLPNESKKKIPKIASKKKIIELKDLLEETLDDVESSDDEDFVAGEEDMEKDGDHHISCEENDLSEDTDDLQYQSVNSEEDQDLTETETEDEDEDFSKRKLFEKSSKPSKVDRLEQIIRRKPHLGGVQKYSKKSLKNKKSVKNVQPTAKDKMKIAAVKEINKKEKIKPIKAIHLKKNKNKKKV